MGVMGIMAGSYEDRDGKIWMDGELVDWRDAKVHVLTHALHYASAVFEGERCYDGKIFKSRQHSERLLKSGELIDMEIPWTAEQICANCPATSTIRFPLIGTTPSRALPSVTPRSRSAFSSTGSAPSGSRYAAHTCACSRR